MAKLNGTHLIHGDSGFSGTEVSPSISVTTTFRVPHPDEHAPGADGFDWQNPSRYMYSRYTQNVSTRVEHILNKINHGNAITYSSGIAAAYAALVHFKPKRIAITGGYPGCHASIAVYAKNRFEPTPIIGIDDEFQEGDLCWVETPVNPTGESRDIQYYADKIHAVGGKLIVDSTFGPPPLQYPFKWGADCILHSATKYFGGHSDLLAGILIVKTEQEWNDLFGDRCYLGSMMGSFESWLLLRSLRTLHLRIPRQSASGTELAQWLSRAVNVPVGQEYDGVPGGVVTKVWHSSLQGINGSFDPAKQMEGGFSATFSFLLSKREYAELLPHSLEYFVPASSLGGVESLAEYSHMRDPNENPLLIRLSIGVEEVEDLKDDLRKAFQKLSKMETKA
ncbi:hypothetical protein SERLADRAFT_475678 [Serpula lacrymans var. lacrymans S7.9]|nr:uncharacterized protein SERLADRAFT_475678 [Serpula lacrymans var. lacrymans S7.9]EGO21041.1 hypothetical protein SERLADRAFT_475678 [Serpula lacrymans var. lacrymans S7.9]